MTGELLTAENWKEAITGAVGELPDDLSDSIGWCDKAQDAVLLTVAVETWDDGLKTDIYSINVAVVDDTGHPFVRVSRGRFPVGVETTLTLIEDFILKFTEVESLKRHIQLSILERMFIGGLVAKIVTDDRFEYVTKREGSTILPWQRTAGNE